MVVNGKGHDFPSNTQDDVLPKIIAHFQSLASSPEMPSSVLIIAAPGLLSGVGLCGQPLNSAGPRDAVSLDRN